MDIKVNIISVLRRLNTFSVNAYIFCYWIFIYCTFNFARTMPLQCNKESFFTKATAQCIIYFYFILLQQLFNSTSLYYNIDRALTEQTGIYRSAVNIMSQPYLVFRILHFCCIYDSLNCKSVKYLQLGEVVFTIAITFGRTVRVLLDQPSKLKEKIQYFS